MNRKRLALSVAVAAAVVYPAWTGSLHEIGEIPRAADQAINDDAEHAIFASKAAAHIAITDAAQDHLDAVYQKTGRRFTNPFSGWYFDHQETSDQWEADKQRMADLAQQRNDPSLAWPDDQTIFNAAVKKARGQDWKQDWEEAVIRCTEMAPDNPLLVGGIAALSHIGGWFVDAALAATIAFAAVMAAPFIARRYLKWLQAG